MCVGAKGPSLSTLSAGGTLPPPEGTVPASLCTPASLLVVGPPASGTVVEPESKLAPPLPASALGAAPGPPPGPPGPAPGPEGWGPPGFPTAPASLLPPTTGPVAAS